MKKSRVIVILGPTATGKSDLAVQIAKKVKGPARLASLPAGSRGASPAGRSVAGGEIISADSRQVYTRLDIGTGKITKREMRDVPHHLLDITSPKKVFNVSDWQKLAKKKIEEIISRGHTPVIVGGTGLYIQSIVNGIVLPEVPPNPTLRKKLEKKSADELFKMLKKLDPARAQTIDKNNKVRLVRAIEITTALGKVPKLKSEKSSYKFVQIGLTANPEVLKKRIHTRLVNRLKQGMITEATRLRKQGLSYKRMRTLGLEYGALADFLEKKISKTELITRLDTEIYQYAKRQMTWFKRDKKIKWFDVEDKKKILKLF